MQRPGKMPGAFTKTAHDIIVQSGYDEDLIHAMRYHFGNLKKNFDPTTCTLEEYWKRLISLMFVSQMQWYKRPQSVEHDLDKKKDWPIPVVPVELFNDPITPASYRKLVFFECLKELDILECTVASVSTDMYTLRVVHKYGVPRYLNDLNIIAYMSTKERKTVYHKYKLIRVVVSGINRIVGENRDPEIFVTDDGTNLTLLTKPKLGVIDNTELPFYIYNPPDTKKFPTFIDYLKSHPSLFTQRKLVGDQLRIAFGVDPNRPCSMHPSFDNFKCSEDELGQTMLTESKRLNIKDMMKSALIALKNEKLDQAIVEANEVIELCPETDPNASKLYLLRAKAYSEKVNPRVSRACLIDTVEAIRINPNERIAIKIFKHHLSRIAFIHYHLKNYEEAAELAAICLALEKDNDNTYLQRLIRHLKMKNVEVMVPKQVQSRSIQQLQHPHPTSEEVSRGIQIKQEASTSK